ncbi:IS66 family transposase [Cyclobacterium lianum]
MLLIVAGQKYHQDDKTPIKFLDRDLAKGIHHGYMWQYHAPADRLVFFDYRKGRDRSGPREMLADFMGSSRRTVIRYMIPFLGTIPTSI